MRTSSSHRCPDDYLSAAARHAVSVVDWLVTIPSGGHAVRAGRKQLTITGPLNLSALSKSPRFSSGLVNAPGQAVACVDRALGPLRLVLLATVRGHVAARPTESTSPVRWVR
jgi:hypothetical protein